MNWTFSYRHPERYCRECGIEIRRDGPLMIWYDPDAKEGVCGKCHRWKTGIIAAILSFFGWSLRWAGPPRRQLQPTGNKGPQ